MYVFLFGVFALYQVLIASFSHRTNVPSEIQGTQQEDRTKNKCDLEDQESLV